MTKRKVIEDSDDEENAEASPPRPSVTGLSDITLSTLVSLDGSTSQEIPEQTADPSTSSTELLNRESRAAHKSLIEPTPRSTLPAISTHSSSQQRTPASPTTSRLKTKRSKTSVEKPKTKKPLKTYGKSSQNIFEFHGGSDGELDITASVDLFQEAGRRKKNEHSRFGQAASRQSSQSEVVTEKPIASSQGHTELLVIESKSNEVSLAPEKEVSLQSSLPPPVSKSLSIDQSQQSQRNTMLTITESAPSESAGHNVLPPAGLNYSEIHTDDRMSAPTQSVKPQFVHTKEAMESSEQQPNEEPAPSSSASEITPSKIITVKRRSQMKGSISTVLDPNMPAMADPVIPLPEPADTEGTQDELSLSIPKAASKNPAESATASKRKRETDDKPIDELDSDDNAIGVPKEHYQPRPSKRRSGGDGEILVPTDYSKRPEAMSKGKRKTKRHKTTAFQELLPQDEDEDEEVNIVPDPRFKIPEKKSLKLSTKRNQLDLDKEGNLEGIRPEAQGETNQAAKSTSHKKRGRPKKVVTNLSEEIVVDEVEASHDQDDTEAEEPVLTATAKKSGKKAQAQAQKIPAPTIDDQTRNQGGTPAAEVVPEDRPSKVLNEIPANITPAAKPLSELSPAKANTALPESPRKSATPAPKGPDKHSPISSGKVAYRVGLSKRARIAPLLRIVRK